MGMVSIIRRYGIDYLIRCIGQGDLSIFNSNPGLNPHRKGGDLKLLNAPLDLAPRIVHLVLRDDEDSDV